MRFMAGVILKKIEIDDLLPDANFHEHVKN